MKKSIAFTIALFFIQTIGFSQIIPIPDANFKYKLIHADTTNQTANFTVIDSNHNGEIEQSEALLVDYLFLYNSNITDLTGIEYFTNLQTLGFHFNPISNVNLLTLTQLKFIACHNTNLTTLNLTGLYILESIRIDNNNFTSFDATGLPNLKYFACMNTPITTLDFSNNALFNNLIAYNMPNLVSINLQNGAVQTYGTNPLVPSSELCMSNNPNLTHICADANEIAGLNSMLASCNITQAITIDSSCPLAVEGFVEGETISVSPNPSEGLFNLNFNNNEKELIEMTVYNMIGQLLFKDDIKKIENYTLDLCKYPKGTYLLKFAENENCMIKKIIIR